MASSFSVIKTLIVPAIISLTIFLLLTFVVIPVWRRYRNRYSQYLPLDTISSQTSSLRHRITNRIGSLFLPSTWSRNREVASAVGPGGPGSDDGLDLGEELGDVDDETWRAIDRQLGGDRPDNTRRLSRDLEEGFRDDSDEEPDR